MKKQKEKKRFKMKKNQAKGITLIALVITIIVLLILAGVTIATLTGENGILTRASDASRETEIASVKEQAQLDISNWIAEELENGRDATVNTPEKVQEILELANQNNEDKYYKVFTETGVTTPNGYEVPYEELYTNGSSGEETTSKTIEDLVAGDRVYYDTGNTSVGNEGIIECIVLYDKAYNDANGTDYGIQIISSDVIKTTDGTVETVSLGYNDPTVTGDNNFEKARDSYNNVLKTLYDKAQEYKNPTYISIARCVGSDPADPDWDTTTNEAGYYTRQVAEQKGEYQSYMEPYYGTFKNGDDNYDIDRGKMIGLGICSSSDYYWLASRSAFSAYGQFGVIIMYPSTYMSPQSFCRVESNDNTYSYGGSHGFRPVFTLNSGIKVTNGDGKATPYTLTP